MTVFERLQAGVRVTAAAVMGLWAALPELTQLLVWLMVADTVLGLMVAVKRRNLSAKLAWNGATKKIGSLLLIGIAGLLNPHVQSFIEINLVQAASAFYIVPELTSIARNAAILDIPVFVQFRTILGYFQAVAGETDAAGKTTK